VKSGTSGGVPSQENGRVNRPSQDDWTQARLDALPVRISVPTTASVLGVGPKTLRRLFDESHDGRTARVQVGGKEFVIAGMQLGRQLWVITETVTRILRARGP
jgi:hypothetical protein